MQAVLLKLGPADHGRRLSLADFEAADYEPGFRYEVIDGRLYVSPAPNFAENFLETWLSQRLHWYARDRPDVVRYVTVKPRVFVREADPATVPEPDIAVYQDLPLTEDLRDIHWRDLKPLIVVEVLVDGDIGKDLTRNPELYLTLPPIQEYWVLNGASDPDRPSLIQHARKGKKRWAVTTFSYGSAFATKLLPGFELVIDPRK